MRITVPGTRYTKSVMFACNLRGCGWILKDCTELIVGTLYYANGLKGSIAREPRDGSPGTYRFFGVTP